MFNRPYLFALIAIILPGIVSESSAQSRESSRYRKLAPGVIKRILPSQEINETFSGPRDMVEIVKGDPNLDWTPNFSPKSDTLLAKAKSTVFRRPIWGLEFGFKPIRLIEVNGKKIWYLLYYVKNNGKHLNPTPEKDDHNHDVFTAKPVDHSVRFFPTFVLESHEYGQAYMDSVLPSVVDAIRKQNDPNRKIYDSVEISSVPIEVSTPEEDKSVWGAATWTNVDPRTDFFSVYIQGLTNAFHWQDPEGAYEQGDPPGKGRRFSFKTLQINFWRPGDALNLDEMEFRYGLPTKAQLPPDKTEDEVIRIYRLQERVDHQWIYR